MQKANESVVERGAGKIEEDTFSKSAVKSVTLPSTLRESRNGHFTNVRIKRVEIPSDVEYIENECVEHSGIEEIALPGTLEEIAEDAFSCCSNLEVV